MPELPEVEAVVKGLQKNVIGKKIVSLKAKRPKIIVGDAEQDLGKIRNVLRRGKYIILEANAFIIIHLRMTGKLLLVDRKIKERKYVRAVFLFDDDKKLLFDDVRAFGRIVIKQDYQEYLPIQKLGPEPLFKNFNFDYFAKKIENRKAPIKNILLDQTVIAGLGNIYTNEILHRAQIDPRKSANKLKKKQLQTLISETKNVMKEAITAGGTTISDFRDLSGKSGGFQKKLEVYQKEFCVCGEKITRIKQAGRSTFFCAKCQK